MTEQRFLVDSYQEWIGREGIPIYEDFGLDLLTVDVADWPRMGARGAYTLVKGRGDFLDTYVLELLPGASTSPQRHLFEEVVYVLEGAGSTTLRLPGEREMSFEWGEKSVFALPLNAEYRHFNASGQRRVRLASTTNLPMVMKAFHNSDFIYNNPFEFPERLGEEDRFHGGGTLIRNRPGRHMWETNLVPDLSSFELESWLERGAGSSNIMFVLADGTMHAHVSEIPVGTYKKGHRHGADFHIFAVSGEGYSLLWYEGDADFRRVDWRHGVLYAPPDLMFHQHFNVSPSPARYLAVAFGGLRYPFSEDKRRTYMGMDLDIRKGGRQIEYEDEDPRIRAMYESELGRRGMTSRMAPSEPAEAAS